MKWPFSNSSFDTLNLFFSKIFFAHLFQISKFYQNPSANFEIRKKIFNSKEISLAKKSEKESSDILKIFQIDFLFEEIIVHNF